MKKKLIIFAAIVVAVLGVALLVVALLGKKNKQNPQDPDSEYQYSFRNEEKNIIISVKGNFKEEHTWHIENDREDVVKASVKSVTAKKTEILAEPAGRGTATVVLALENDDLMPDRLYELHITLSVDVDGSMTIVNSTHRDCQPKEKHGTDTEHPYEFILKNDGSLQVYVMNVKTGIMKVSCEPKEFALVNFELTDTGIKIENSDQTEQQILYNIRALQEGTGTVFLIDTEDGKALKLTLTADEELDIQVDAHEIVDYDYEAENTKDVNEEAEKLVGKLTIPGASDVKCKVYDVWEADGTTRRAVSYDLTYNGKKCLFLAVPGASAELMRDYICMMESEETEITLEGKKASLYADAYALAWMDDGVGCGVVTDSVEAVKKLASEIMKANPVIRGTAE